MTDDSELRKEIVTVIPRMRRFARGLAGNSADADDLVQVALEKALTRLHQFQPGTRLDSWLFRILQTSFLDARRKAARSGEEQDMEALVNLADPTATTADRAVRLRDVDRALATLPDDQRVIIMSVLVEGNSYKEAADQLQLPIGTVMSRLSRARRTLAAHLREVM